MRGSCLALMYLGVMGSFALAIRIEYGLWALLMFVFVVKASDIGAFTVGRLIGKHKFAPRVSPGKTWEGLGGAMAFASIVAAVFAGLTGPDELARGPSVRSDLRGGGAVRRPDRVDVQAGRPGQGLVRDRARLRRGAGRLGFAPVRGPVCVCLLMIHAHLVG